LMQMIAIQHLGRQRRIFQRNFSLAANKPC